MKRTIFIALSALTLFTAKSAAAEKILPDATYLFAVKDSTELYLDVYEPKVKAYEKTPTVIFAFGGGFRGGHRDAGNYLGWFGHLRDSGVRLVSIDYRLGLKGATGLGFNLKSIEAFKYSIRIAVEDLFSATRFIIDNAAELGIDTDLLIASGASAGAITAIQGEWLICNSSPTAKEILPEGFNFAGVMAFAGAILSETGGISFDKTPCPVLLCHGNKDRIVHFGHIAVFNLFFGSSPAIAEALAKQDCNYNYLCFDDKGHEIASVMEHIPDEIGLFIRRNVINGEKRIVEATISDPAIITPEWGKKGLSTLY